MLVYGMSKTAAGNLINLFSIGWVLAPLFFGPFRPLHRIIFPGGRGRVPASKEKSALKDDAKGRAHRYIWGV
jgi:hypothetical protein